MPPKVIKTGSAEVGIGSGISGPTRFGNSLWIFHLFRRESHHARVLRGELRGTRDKIMAWLPRNNPNSNIANTIPYPPVYPPWP